MPVPLPGFPSAASDVVIFVRGRRNWGLLSTSTIYRSKPYSALDGFNPWVLRVLEIPLYGPCVQAVVFFVPKVRSMYFVKTLNPHGSGVLVPASVSGFRHTEVGQIQIRLNGAKAV
jgi:hypothetical protein